MLLHQVINDEPPSPRRLSSNVPKDLETICLKCLEKDPDKRYPTAHELGEELRRLLGGETIHARPISRMARGWRWCKRNLLIAGLAVAFVATLIVGLTSTSWQWYRAEGEAKRANTIAEEKEDARREAVVAKEHAQQETEAKRQQLYISDMNCRRHRPGKTTTSVASKELLKRYVPANRRAPTFGVSEWYYLWKLCSRGPRSNR